MFEFEFSLSFTHMHARTHACTHTDTFQFLCFIGTYQSYCLHTQPVPLSKSDDGQWWTAVSWQLAVLHDLYAERCCCRTKGQVVVSRWKWGWWWTILTSVSTAPRSSRPSSSWRRTWSSTNQSRLDREGEGEREGERDRERERICVCSKGKLFLRNYWPGQNETERGLVGCQFKDFLFVCLLLFGVGWRLCSFIHLFWSFICVLSVFTSFCGQNIVTLMTIQFRQVYDKKTTLNWTLNEIIVINNIISNWFLCVKCLTFTTMVIHTFLAFGVQLCCVIKNKNKAFALLQRTAIMLLDTSLF